MYSSTLFLTSAVEVGEGPASRPGRTLPPGKTRYPLYRRLGGPQGRSGQVWKISPPPGFDPRNVQPVGSRYTDWATRRPNLIFKYKKMAEVTLLECRYTIQLTSSQSFYDKPVSSFTLACLYAVFTHTGSNVVENACLLLEINQIGTGVGYMRKG